MDEQMSDKPAALTHDALKTLLSYDPSTGAFTWLVNRGNLKNAGSIAGSLNRGGYAQLQISGKCYRLHRLAWFYVHGVFPDGDLDHINGVRSDNRIENLRICSKQQNALNKLPQRNGFKGVTLHKQTGKFQAQITKSNKNHYLGLFATEQAAAQAYDAASSVMHGEFGRPNFGATP